MGDPMEQRDEAHNTIDDLRAAFVRARHALRTIVRSEWLAGSDMRQIAREELAHLDAVNAAPFADPASKEATMDDLRAVNAVLRAQLEEAEARHRLQMADAEERLRAVERQRASAEDGCDEWARKFAEADQRGRSMSVTAMETQRALETARAETHETLLRALRVIEAVAGVRP